MDSHYLYVTFYHVCADIFLIIVTNFVCDSTTASTSNTVKSQRDTRNSTRAGFVTPLSLTRESVNRVNRSENNAQEKENPAVFRKVFADVKSTKATSQDKCDRVVKDVENVVTEALVKIVE